MLETLYSDRLKLGKGVWVLVLMLGCVGIAEAEVPSFTVRPSVDQNMLFYAADSNVSGEITIVGSETMQPMLAKLAAQFMRLHPGVSFTVEAHGSTDGIREFSLGKSLQRRGDKSREGHDGASTPTMPIVIATDVSAAINRRNSIPFSFR